MIRMITDPDLTLLIDAVTEFLLEKEKEYKKSKDEKTQQSKMIRAEIKKTRAFLKEFVNINFKDPWKGYAQLRHFFFKKHLEYCNLSSSTKIFTEKWYCLEFIAQFYADLSKIPMRFFTKQRVNHSEFQRFLVNGKTLN
jgi:hypothetical protein